MILTIIFFCLISDISNLPIQSADIVQIHRRSGSLISVVAGARFSVSWSFTIDPDEVVIVGIQATKDNETYEIANKKTFKTEFSLMDDSYKSYGINLNNTIFSVEKVPKHWDGYKLELIINYNPSGQAKSKLELYPIGEIKLMRTLGTTERKKGALIIIPITIIGVMTLLAVIMIMLWQIRSYKKAQRSAMLLTDLGDDEDKKKKSSYVVLAQKILEPNEIDENGLPKKSNWI